ncbi:hypothetical protein [Paenibacillus polymyxa]|uniref:Uncharacterized protein n=2 Tax=Paenibacillus TaxID=44249 RepID=A0ABX2ZCM8_PAEPO|nr:hypothetical protein [Paenibacillus polymyxa]ODA08740.1 hypothetical protein A7312_04880 [Paenibacillus polymyxa]QYK68239.1 hypothetical protein KAI36_03390 [Paenibacillus sp. S02]
MGNANKIYGLPFSEVQAIAITMQQYQLYIDDTIKRVKMDVGDLAQDSEAIKMAIKEILSSNQISSTKEDGNMQESIVELKQKTSSIEKTVGDIKTDVAVLENTVKLSFETVNATLSEIKKSLDDIKKPLAEMTVQIAEVNKDVSTINSKLQELVTNKKFYITSGLTILGLAVTIYRLYFV